MAIAAITSQRAGSAPRGTLPIAIDFGASSLKLLQIQAAAAESPSLIAAAQVPTPHNLHNPAKRFEFQFEHLAKAVKSAGFRGRRAVVAIPAAQTFCQHMRLPKQDPDADAVLRAQVAAKLAVAPDSLIYRSYKVDADTANKAETICTAASRDFVQKLMEVVRAARLELVGIQPEFIATLRAFSAAPSGEDATATMYLDIGAGTTKVCIAHDDRIVFAKVIPLAGNEFDKVVARRLALDELSAKQARIFARNLTGSCDDGADDNHTATATATQDTVDIATELALLTDELRMCTRYHENIFQGKGIDRIVFTGGESRNQSLCTHIAHELATPGYVADPLASLARTGKEPCEGIDLTTPQPGWAVALGLGVCPTDL